MILQVRYGFRDVRIKSMSNDREGILGLLYLKHCFYQMPDQTIFYNVC